VRLTPRSSSDRLEGLKTLSDGRCVLSVRVRAAPEDGEANKALLRLLARELGISASNCVLASGGKSRLKSVGVTGDADALASGSNRFAVRRKTECGQIARGNVGATATMTAGETAHVEDQRRTLFRGFPHR